MSDRPIESCQYCTPTTGGHEPDCIVLVDRRRAVEDMGDLSAVERHQAWRARAERAEARVAELEQEITEIMAEWHTEIADAVTVRTALRVRVEVLALRVVAEAAEMLHGQIERGGPPWPFTVERLRAALAAWRGTT